MKAIEILDIDLKEELLKWKYMEKLIGKSGLMHANMPKAGAAGGLGAAFLLLGCKLIKGIDLVLKHTEFNFSIWNCR